MQTDVKEHPASVMLYYVLCQTRKNIVHPFKHASTAENTYMRIYYQTWACSVTHTLNPLVDLFIPSSAVAWPANHNICHVAVTTGLTLHSAQTVHIDLTDFGCSDGMSIQ